MMYDNFCHWCDRYVDEVHFSKDRKCALELLEREANPNPYICSFCGESAAFLNTKTHWSRSYQYNSATQISDISISWYHHAVCDEHCELRYKRESQKKNWEDPDWVRKYYLENPNRPKVNPITGRDIV